MNKSLRGSLLLLLGSVIWGAAFVAQRVGMDHLGPYTFNGVRMLLAWLVMLPVTRLFENKAKKAVVEKLQSEGWKDISFLPNTEQMTRDTEEAVDGCHPNDWGMMHMGEGFARAIRKALKK